MAKILLGIVAVIASFMLAESLKCNKCSVGVFGLCLIPTSTECSTNTSVCFTTKATFSSISSFAGFSSQGCTESTTCGNSTSVTTNSTLAVLNIAYDVETTCCSNDKCNTVSAAPATKMTLSVAMSAAALAAVWGSLL